MHHIYTTRGTCSRQIEFDIDGEGRVHNVRFAGGCNGNLQGIAAMVEGCRADEVASRLAGIRCGVKSTSCPDQLAQALAEAGAC